MIWNAVAGTVGIAVQVAAFLFVLFVSAKRQGVSRGLVNAGVVSVYGYALLVSLFALLTISWQLLNVALAAAIAASLAFRPVRLAISNGITPVRSALRRSWIPTLVVVVVISTQAVVAGFDPELSIDGQLYHGPILANILQSGSLWGWTVPNQYMYYTDLTMAGGVNLATFTGITRFDNAIQIPHLLILIFIINWALARRFRSAFVRVSLAILMVAAPVIWLQPRILYVDLAYGAAVVGCIFFAAFVSEFRKIDVLVAGILVSAVFATKPTGILTGLVLLVALVSVIVVRRRLSSRSSKTVGILLLEFGVPLAMATSFYLRNLFQFGNPAYPVRANVGPIDLPGILDLSVFTSGDRGTGLIDFGRLGSYFSSIGFGMVHGVTKLDYDPRAGGYGYVPLALLAVAIVLIAVQVFLRVRAHKPRAPWLTHWRPQLGILGLVVIILAVQPSSFDSRYVIGPTVALVVVVLLTAVFAVPSVFQVIAGVLALLMAGSQMWSTERHMYPGISASLYISRLPPAEQPDTPGNPWGRGTQVAWLPPDSAGCVSVALQTSGGITAAGMDEMSYLGTLPYGLYGDMLCNRIAPVTLNANSRAANATALEGAGYVVFYKNDVDRWEATFPKLALCLTRVDSIAASVGYPQAEVVLRDTCAVNSREGF